MNQPWTSKLFLKINSLVGRWSVVDLTMIFSAKYLIWILSLFLFLFFLYDNRWRAGFFIVWCVVFGTMFLCSFFFSYLIAWLFPHPRPIRQFPDIHVLIRTWGTWKSFPSDHAIGATILAYGALLTLTGSIRSIFMVCAVLVAVSRVWVGVHYPRDIIAGIVVGSTVALVIQQMLFIG
ncbi:MAG: hypothetical protein CO029_01265 [Candidatus Magasanikbacteria bacterium CG_4_9_14_0_2_um_filter_41_10]|uniref:Phosphatidic acid phosphatase type 2/haloperoxidase domain-containing protein n=1 Tax=Candidatus Magasanikbacteria bacterium CG_4_10_14_0_2_um_filter_41_31 TaxID=1974639 RepID=A0A2M7V555_9BACT|nr:MAG: hypothetical protein AUJ37_01875 [Candidatus Magasanikbacteria bacterium CG1_02_41_34]PIZ93721.1 MAG: hypothetical protein COX83_01135 [Candidatus Magasanikbacteria bacterium CG_4_10_14_0_2_um_filter_41_31]PJC53709.1 MAG: hypothetical protein CO029_01265 [Candidatus Magasanikbacteria bacterium CG_4_9_14_0_2_um_filter_41_10]